MIIQIAAWFTLAWQAFVILMLPKPSVREKGSLPSPGVVMLCMVVVTMCAITALHSLGYIQ